MMTFVLNTYKQCHYNTGVIRQPLNITQAERIMF